MEHHLGFVKEKLRLLIQVLIQKNFLGKKKRTR